jgi:hypothetical protein
MTSSRKHQNELLRRRVKFVVEKGAMARLFVAGKNQSLQRELCRQLRPEKLSRILSQQDYDAWLVCLIQSDIWKPYSRNGLDKDRWAYFAKLVNIIVYEIVSNRELCSQATWNRIKKFLHLPIDSSVKRRLSEETRMVVGAKKLKGMSQEEYWEIQNLARQLGKKKHVSPIWFEAAWSE